MPGGKPTSAPPCAQAAAGDPVLARRPTAPEAARPVRDPCPRRRPSAHLPGPHPTTDGGSTWPPQPEATGRPVRRPPDGDLEGGVLQHTASIAPTGGGQTCRAGECDRDRCPPPASDQPADRTKDRQEGAPMMAAFPGEIHHSPLNATVRPCGRVRPKSLPFRQKSTRRGQTVAVGRLNPQTPREQGVGSEG